MRYLLLFLILLSGCVRPEVSPQPNPDQVVNPPTPVAIDAKLRVLILFENDELGRLPTSQLLAIQGPQIRDWLKANNAEFRIWDQHTDTQYADKFWQEAIKLPHQSLPWIWISGGKDGKGVNGPLPQSADDVIALLEKVRG